MTLKSRVLKLPLKAQYFNEIKAGIKPLEFRLVTPFWTKRLEGKTFDIVEITLGYPKAGDPEKTLYRKFISIKRQTITHPFFGPEPVEVFAIDVTTPL